MINPTEKLKTMEKQAADLDAALTSGDRDSLCAAIDAVTGGDHAVINDPIEEIRTVANNIFCRLTEEIDALDFVFATEIKKWKMRSLLLQHIRKNRDLLLEMGITQDQIHEVTAEVFRHIEENHRGCTERTPENTAGLKIDPLFVVKVLLLNALRILPKPIRKSPGFASGMSHLSKVAIAK